MVQDVGSGINWKRKGLQTILDWCLSGELEEVVVAHKDRLCRFGFELLESIFSKQKVRLVVLNRDEEKSPEQELAEDVISIIHIYSCKSYGKQRYKNRGDNKDEKNKIVSDCCTETDVKKLDGDSKICVQ